MAFDFAMLFSSYLVHFQGAGDLQGMQPLCFIIFLLRKVSGQFTENRKAENYYCGFIPL